MLKRLNLRTRMLLFVMSAAFLSFTFTVWYVTHKTRTVSKAEALAKAQESGYRYSGIVKAEMERALDISRTLAQTFEAFLDTGQAADRKVFNRILRHLLERHPGFIGIWTCWEPDALDGRDRDFANSPGHDGTGRYIPYWTRASGGITLEPLRDYMAEGIGDYYQVPRKTGREVILNPFKYTAAGKKILITTLAVPIRHKGAVKGVVGIDIVLSSLNRMVSQLRPFETGYGVVLANNGVIVTHPKTGAIGRDAREYVRDKAVFKAIRHGKKYALYRKDVVSSQDSYQIFTPFFIGDTGTAWSLCVSVPKHKVMKHADELTFMTVIIGSLSLCFLIIIVFFIARGITTPVFQIAKGLSNGSEQVASASAQISSSSQQLARGASEQASSLEQTGEELRQMLTLIRQSGDNAKSIKNARRDAIRAIKSSTRHMREAGEAVRKIQIKGQEIRKIIKTINEIAFQTNLLALNAGVEAARAGRAGAGFAVVADEVRNLALRSSEAARDTQVLIEGTVEQIRIGGQLIEKTQAEFNEAVDNNKKSGKIVDKIAQTSDEQARRVEQLARSVSDMEKIIRYNATSAEESVTASEAMNVQARLVKKAANQLLAVIAVRSNHNGHRLRRRLLG